MDSSRAEELYMKYGGYGPLKERAAFYNMLYLLQQSPSYRGVVTYGGELNDVLYQPKYEEGCSTSCR